MEDSAPRPIENDAMSKSKYEILNYSILLSLVPRRFMLLYVLSNHIYAFLDPDIHILHNACLFCEMNCARIFCILCESFF